MNRKLAELAEAYGVQTSYKDMWHKRRDASPESLLIVLRALGAPVETLDDIDDALRFRRQQVRSRVEPVTLAWNGKLSKSALHLPSRSRVSLTLEDGTKTTLPGGPGGPTGNLPSGYHRLTVETSDNVSETLVISAPVKANFPLRQRSWGVFAPVYALHSKHSRGAGDLTDLDSLTQWMQGLGGSVTATLPLLANYMEDPYEPSPYSPVSRIFWNEFYIDPERTEEFKRDPKADRLIDSKSSRSKLVDYRRTMAVKGRVLEHLAASFFERATDTRRNAFERFLRANPAVTDYACFRATTDKRRAGWRAWPERLRSGDIRKGDYDESVYRYHLYVQWQAQEQMEDLAGRSRARNSVLYLDLPLGLHADSYDTWKHRDFFVKDMAGGAPPDPVFTTGQNWGFPPMHPQAMRENRHQYTIAYIRNHLQYAGLLRIDHVMGLHRLYWIPDGLSGDKGVYVNYPAEELYAILSLESHRHNAGIVGENLGTVPPEVRTAMSKHNIQEMYVVQYEIVDDSKRTTLRKPPADSVASLNTHDMPPFQAFLDGTDIPDRLDLKFLDTRGAREEKKRRMQLRKALDGFLKKKKLLKGKDVFEAAIRFLAASPAAIVLINLEDLWKETNPQNVPATSKERPNWRRKLRYSLEELSKMRDVETLLRDVNRLRTDS